MNTFLSLFPPQSFYKNQTPLRERRTVKMKLKKQRKTPITTILMVMTALQEKGIGRKAPWLKGDKALNLRRNRQRNHLNHHHQRNTNATFVTLSCQAYGSLTYMC